MSMISATHEFPEIAADPLALELAQVLASVESDLLVRLRDWPKWTAFEYPHPHGEKVLFRTIDDFDTKGTEYNVVIRLIGKQLQGLEHLVRAHKNVAPYAMCCLTGSFEQMHTVDGSQTTIQKKFTRGSTDTGVEGYKRRFALRALEHPTYALVVSKNIPGTFADFDPSNLALQKADSRVVANQFSWELTQAFQRESASQ